MTRNGKYKKPPITLEPKYRSLIVTKLVNNLMFEGKKQTAYKIVYFALQRVSKEQSRDALCILLEVVDLLKPTCFIRYKKIASKKYMIPVPIKEEKAISMSMKWIRKGMEARKERTAIVKLYSEFCAILKQDNSEALKLRAQYLKTAKDNEIYAHYI